MNWTILKGLQNKQEPPCISIYQSTDLNSFKDKEMIRLKLKNSIRQARKLMLGNYDAQLVKELITSLEALVSEVDLNHLQKGVGIFVSPQFKEWISLPFPIEDQMHIDNFFVVTDILNAQEKWIDYTVLLLSKKRTRLFLGAGNQLTEIEDENFPCEYENEFQVQRTSPGSFYNNEESKINHARMLSYLRKLDALISSYKNDNALVLIGVKKFLADFKSVSKYNPKVIAEVTGNFDKFSKPEISQLVWPPIDRYLTQNKSAHQLG